MKYLIQKINDHSQWDNLVSKSLNNNIFLKSYYLMPLEEKVDFYIIKKTSKIIAGFALLRDKKKNIINNDLVIHSGIFFLPDDQMKSSSFNNQVFEVTDLFKDFLIKNYNNINITLSPGINDIRSFQWHNYNTNKKKFKINIKYTSFLDLKKINKENYHKSKLYLNLNENRKRNLKDASKNKISFIEEKPLTFVKNYSLMFKKKGEIITSKKKIQIEKLLKNLIKLKKAKIITSIVKGNKEYTIAISWDDKKGYYLFGSPIKNLTNFSGTATMWKCMDICKENKIDIFDLEGINSPLRGAYKLSYGGELVNYYNLQINR